MSAPTNVVFDTMILFNEENVANIYLSSSADDH